MIFIRILMKVEMSGRSIGGVKIPRAVVKPNMMYAALKRDEEEFLYPWEKEAYLNWTELSPEFVMFHYMKCFFISLFFLKCQSSIFPVLFLENIWKWSILFRDFHKMVAEAEGGYRYRTEEIFSPLYAVRWFGAPDMKERMAFHDRYDTKFQMKI